jgi:GT2 family glycosyltransferase
MIGVSGSLEAIPLIVETTPLVAAVVVNWNNAELSLELLESLRCQRFGRLLPIVVDNGSEYQKDFLHRLASEFPEAKVVAHAKNLGYAGGCNAGITLALKLGADYVFLLNNDVILDPATTAELVRALELHPEAGAAGPVIYYASQPNRVSFAGGRLSLGMRPVVGHEPVDNSAVLRWDGPRATAWLTGAAMLVSKRCITETGMLDSDFFLYWEDVDWSCRARQRGYKLLVVPTARIWHRINASASTRPVAALYYSERNLLLFIERWATLWIRSWNRAKVLFRVVALSIRRPTNEESRVRLLAYKDYLFRRFGARRGFFT